MTVEMEVSKQLVIGEVLARWARKTPDKEVFIFKDRRVSYNTLNKHINRLSHGLMKLGIGKGDKVAVLFMNCIEIVEIYMALGKLGAVAVPLNFRLAAPEIIYQLNQSDSKAVIFDKMFMDLVQSIRGELPKIQNAICRGGKALSDIIDYEELLGSNSSDEPAVLVSDDEPAFIMYTAGTTGKPKGAVMTHKNVLTAVISGMIECQLKKGDRTAFSAPLFHIAALIQMLMSVYLGETCFILDEWEPKAFLELVENEQITIAQLLPVMWISLLEVPNIGDYDTHSLRVVFTAAAVMPEELIKKAEAAFPNVGIYNIFGQTESTGGMTIQKPDDMFNKPGSVGQRVLGAEARIVDDNDRDVPVGTIGEIVYRGPTVMKEYYKNPEATSEAMIGGWLHSGDLVREDEDGFIYVVDRKKDMIISGGENIYAAEVEEVLFAHPKISEAAIIGVPDPKWGETVKAIIVPKQDQTITKEEIVEHCKQRLASYKKPTSVEFVESLPRNAAGKVLKFELRKKFSE